MTLQHTHPSNKSDKVKMAADIEDDLRPAVEYGNKWMISSKTKAYFNKHLQQIFSSLWSHELTESRRIRLINLSLLMIYLEFLH